MTEKAKGGRGKKAKNPYERFTVTLPPDLRVWLDDEAQRRGVGRSEALAVLLTDSRARMRQMEKIGWALPKETSMSGKAAAPAAPAVLPGTPSLFQATSTPTLKPTPKKEKKTVSAAKKPKAPKPTAPAAPGGTGLAATPLHADQMRVTGSKLSTAQAMICAGLQLPGAVAEYDTYERRWMVGFAGAPAREADLEELARLGILEVTGEGKAAVYKLAEPQPKKPTTPPQGSTPRGPRARPGKASATKPEREGQHQGGGLQPVAYRLARLPRRDLLSDIQRYVVELLEAGRTLQQDGDGKAYFAVDAQGVALRVHAGTIKTMIRNGLLRPQNGDDVPR